MLNQFRHGSFSLRTGDPVVNFQLIFRGQSAVNVNFITQLHPAVGGILLNLHRLAVIAFGTITQLVLENIPAEELEDIIDWCIELGLPVTLKELGITEVTDEKLMAVATAACAENDTLHNMPFEVTPETVCAAIKAADAYGKYFLGE